MFRVLENAKTEFVEITLDEERVRVPRGISVAAALLYLGIMESRQTTISQSPRGPFCMMGVCFECLMEIDGSSSQQACQVNVQPGMQVRRRLEKFDCGDGF
jgi:predicted molibdopterin-dependent oxidoreductase YjgC